jgi:hypothetical protein
MHAFLLVHQEWIHNMASLRSILTHHPVTVGLLVRLTLAWLLPALLDDGKLIPGVAYTDIDL